MDDGSRLPIIISVLLLFGAFYFAVAETAFAACSRNRIKAAVERNESGAKQALYILDHFDRAMGTVGGHTQYDHHDAGGFLRG